MIVIGVDGFDKFILMALDLLLSLLGPANGPLRSFTVPVFVNQLRDRALLAIKLIALAAVKSNVLEIKLSLAVWVLAMLRLGRLGNQLLGVGLVS